MGLILVLLVFPGAYLLMYLLELVIPREKYSNYKGGKW